MSDQSTSSSFDDITELDLDELLNNARRPERYATICLRGDLEAEHDKAVDELARLVAANGEVVPEGDDDEPSLATVSRARALRDREIELRTEMRRHSRKIRMVAMPSDEWDVFDNAHRGKDGKVTNLTKWADELIAKVAVEPNLTPADVAKLRKNLSASQMTHLGNTAYAVCTKGGFDLPKSPSFLADPTPRQSAES